MVAVFYKFSLIHSSTLCLNFQGPNSYNDPSFLQRKEKFKECMDWVAEKNRDFFKIRSWVLN